MGSHTGKPARAVQGAAIIAFCISAACAAFAAQATPARPAAAAPLSSARPAAPDTRCIDDDTLDANPPAAPSAAASAGAAPALATPRTNLLTMVQAAMRRSNALGAAKLLTDAAAIEIDEARAGALPVVSLTGSAAGVNNGAPGVPSQQGGQAQASLTLSAPLYDGGRVSDLTSWRTHLADAARYGELSAQEQVALQTVSLALERSRWAVETQVYEQYSRKMSCLVGALQQIVAADKGRMSELVQATKTQQQAELARVQAINQQRITEVRLRRFVGDELPPTAGITSVMLDTPALPDMLAIADRTNEVAQLGAQANALESYMRAILDGQKPQLGWLLAATKAQGAANSHALSGGITLSVPLFDRATDYTVSAARKRAEAARLQREDALDARKYRMREVHEQALQSMDKAHRVVDILRNTELVRESTLEQWQQLGRRSLFDVMAAEGDHYNMRVQYVDALYDTQQSNALLWSLGIGLAVHLQ